MGADRWTVDRWPAGSLVRLGLESRQLLACSGCGLVAASGDTRLMGVRRLGAIEHLAWPDYSP